MDAMNCDIVIVGAGSAGCLMAHHLAKQDHRIVMVEAPAAAPNQDDHERPLQWLNLLRTGCDWDLTTEAVETLANRRVDWPRGRGLGGSSMINSMIWFPPTDADFEMLGEALGQRVSHANLRSLYSLTKDIVQPEEPKWLSPSSTLFLEAAQHCGHNPMTYQRVNRNGRRWNPSQLLKETDVDIVRGLVDRVLFRGDQAVGVQLADGTAINVSHRVILCAGAIGTPTILMRSGFGPKDLLSALEIDVRRACSRIGANLQDHLVMPVVFEVDVAARFITTPSDLDLTQWQNEGGGPVSSNIAECGGLFQDDSIQIHVTPTHYLSYPSGNPSAMTIAVNVSQPEARGRLVVISNDHKAAPIISPNYLAEESDLERTVQGVRLAREIAAAMPLSEHCKKELIPSAKRAADNSIIRSIRRYARSLYHPVGTCAIGPRSDDPVDENLFVRGAENLQVVDASLLPTITRGNPNAMVMTLAAVAAVS